MSTKSVTIAALLAVLVLGTVEAQQKSLSSTLGVYVFPNGGQDASTQSKDEGECYNWAVKEAGVDPFQLADQAKAQQAQAQANAEAAKSAGSGARAGGALKGAAAGALIGEIASDDAGEGAAIGAAAGVVAGGARKRGAQRQAQAQAEAQTQQVQAATQQQMDAFKKAFSVCLEAKKYMVKY
jgi:hypothetical protein